MSAAQAVAPALPPPVGMREVQVCPRCELHQFKGPVSCRRCKWPLPSVTMARPEPVRDEPREVATVRMVPKIVAVTGSPVVMWPLQSGQPLPTMDAMRAALVAEALRRCAGNKCAAARALGLGKTTLYRMEREG